MKLYISTVIALVFLIGLYPFITSNRSTPAKLIVLGEMHLGSSNPIRIQIPSIDVDAYIEYADVSSDGTIGTPEDPNDAAWLRSSPRPGDVGTSIIDGHFGWINHKPAVFDSLSMLKTGDKIYVIDSHHITSTFIVRSMRNYGYKDDASGIFYQADSKSHLNLITCGGAWNIVEQNYSQRLVVFSDLE